MRLGFVGCGKWASKLATAFRACGAEIVAYDRRSGRRSTRCPYGCDGGFEREPGGDVGNERCPQGCDSGYEHFDPEGFGSFMIWRDQLTDNSIDAIVAAAPPEITTEVALACAAAGKPVLATKPLMDHPERITAPFAVDLWRLYSEAHATAKSRAQHSQKPLTISLYGNGPFREFPGAFDYGPHVIAALADIWPDYRILQAAKINEGRGETFRVHACGNGGACKATLYFGNGEGPSDRGYSVEGEFHAEERDTRIGEEEKAYVLQRFCQSFLNDIAEGFVDTRLLNLSRDGMRELRKIREMAG